MSKSVNRGRPVNPKSKLSRARALFNKRTPRAEMLKILKRKLRISAACASTYHQLCKAG